VALPAGIDPADKALLPATTVGGGCVQRVQPDGGWDLSVKLRAGIDNVLNRRLPIVGENLAVGDTNSNQTNLNYYDGLGRRFFIGAKATF
jgi:outer membrane receptor protein involved in Fe transport